MKIAIVSKDGKTQRLNGFTYTNCNLNHSKLIEHDVKYEEDYFKEYKNGSVETEHYLYYTEKIYREGKVNFLQLAGFTITVKKLDRVWKNYVKYNSVHDKKRWTKRTAIGVFDEIIQLDFDELDYIFNCGGYYSLDYFLYKVSSRYRRTRK